MKKPRVAWPLLIAMVLLVGPLLSACGPDEASPTTVPTPPEEATTLPLSYFEHSSGLFSLSHPEGWLVDEGPDDVIINNPPDTLGIFVNVADVGYSLDEAGLQAFIDNFFAAEDGIGANPGFEILEQSTQPDGSILVGYAFDNEGDTARGGSFFEQHGTIVYILSFLAIDDAEWDPMVDTFNEVANSFTATAGGQVSEDWNTLTNEVGGYAIDYPPSWQASDFEGNTIIEKDEETFMAILITTTLPSSNPDEAEQILIDELIEAIRSDDPSAQIDGPDVLPIGGEGSLYADFIYVDPETGLENMGTVVSVVRQGLAYQFLLFTLTEDFSENEDAFVGMLLSFRFLP